MSSRWPLVGRDEELQYLSDALSSSGCVVIAGGAGVGKSRLAGELLALASTHATPRWAVASASAASVPFGAFATLLPPAPESATAHASVHVLSWAARCLSSDAEGKRVVLGVDDAHLLDDLSATLVHQLLLAGEVALVLTVRTGELAPDAVAAIGKDDRTIRVELQPLSRTEVERLLRSVLPPEVDAGTADRVWNLSLGNPLYVRGIVDGGIESGDLGHTGGVWRLRDEADLAPRLSELVSARLERLDADARAVLEVLAYGEPLGPELLSRLVPSAPLVDLERAGLIATEQSGRRLSARVVHPLYSEVLRSRTPVVQARDICRRLADAVEACGARRAEALLRIATWRLESRTAADPAFMATAAVAANAAGDYPLGERLARTALESGDASTAAAALGVSLRWQSRFDEALDVFSSIDRHQLTDGERISVSAAESQALLGMHRHDDAMRALLRAETTVADPWRTYVQAERAWQLASRGRARESLEVAIPLIERADVDDRVKLRAISRPGTAWAASGRAEEALGAATALYPAAIRLRDELPDGPSWVAGTVIWALVMLGRLDEADALLVQRESDATRNPVTRASIRFVQGRIALFRGRPATALGQLRESSALVPPFGIHTRASYGFILMAEACSLLGDTEGANTALERARTGSQDDYSEGDIDRARAWVVALAGERSTGEVMLLGAADRARRGGQHAIELLMLHDAVRLGAAGAATHRLSELRDVVDGRWAPTFASHAAGITDGDAQTLDDAASAFEEIGANLMAAEASYQAADAHRRGGRLARASSSTARAQRLAALCEGAQTPALVAGAHPLPLTPREREVAMLATSGLSNREIAGRLVVSVRTVEDHLQKAYSKLGVSSRQELTKVLRA